jgi:hypothetical protein
VCCSCVAVLRHRISYWLYASWHEICGWWNRWNEREKYQLPGVTKENYQRHSFQFIIGGDLKRMHLDVESVTELNASRHFQNCSCFLHKLSLSLVLFSIMANSIVSTAYTIFKFWVCPGGVIFWVVIKVSLVDGYRRFEKTLPPSSWLKYILQIEGTMFFQATV